MSISICNVFHERINHELGIFYSTHTSNTCYFHYKNAAHDDHDDISKEYCILYF